MCIVGRCRRTGPLLAFFHNCPVDTGLSLNLRALGNADMTHYAYLATNDRVFANLGASRNAGLRSDNRVLSDFNIVRNLNKVVEFYALPNNGRSHGRSVNYLIVAYFDVIFDLYVANLADLLVSAIFPRRKPKTIAADYRSRMNRHMRTDYAIVVYRNSRKKSSVVADSGIVTDVHVGIYLTIVAYYGVFIDVGKCRNIYVFSNLCGWVDKNRLLNPCFIQAHFVVELQ